MPKLNILPQTNKNLIDNNPIWYKDDIWSLENLGINGNKSDKYNTISFKKIQQPWLKHLLKKHILFKGISRGCHSITKMVASIIYFSEYLSALPEKQQIYSETEISRTLIEGYLRFLGSSDNSYNTKNQKLNALKRFFETCIDQKWVPFNGKLIYPEDIPKPANKLPRFIPESVMEQLNAKLNKMNPYVKRMLITLQETGVRIDELLSLNFDCIYQDREGDYFLKYFQFKMNKEHEIPISHDLASIVREQQQTVRDDWGDHKLLFPTPQYISLNNSNKRRAKNRGKKWSRRVLSQYVNDFARAENILGPDGKPWQFKFHDFRHTLATRMINSNIKQHFIQHFLGHESPEMTSRYAHVHNETLKKEFATFYNQNLVSISGDISTPENVIDDIAQGTSPKEIDELWLKRNIMAQALPNGMCSLPAISNKCPHANSCLTCANFRTDKRFLKIHKEQLEKTQKIINTAQKNGWERQYEMNCTVKNSLEKIITTLEEQSNDT
ncbi:MAG: tyrosine-type recombinase/integrase [Gammaproteobacteria bacterium]|jgi:integrase